jgi:RES domain-containing protein
LKAYRIGSNRHPLWDGTGSALQGARWNSLGRGPIYAAETYSGALLEVLVRMSSVEVPPGYEYIAIDIPDDLAIEEVTVSPAEMAKESVTRALGDKWWDAGESPVLLVPSIVTRVERNLLINPRHPGFSRIQPAEPKPVWWDPRLFRP